MDAPSKPLAADLSPAESKKWIGRLLIAVILGAAVWNFVASLTNAVVVPGLARVMEADPQSPLYLGKGDFNFPGFFAAILELCLALIAALVVNSWAQRRPKAIRRKVSSATPAASLSIAPAGTLNRLARNVDEFLRDSARFGIIVTLKPNELALRETLGAVASMRTENGISAITAVINCVPAALFSAADMMKVEALPEHAEWARQRRDLAHGASRARRELGAIADPRRRSCRCFSRRQLIARRSAA